MSTRDKSAAQLANQTLVGTRDFGEVERSCSFPLGLRRWLAAAGCVGRCLGLRPVGCYVPVGTVGEEQTRMSKGRGRTTELMQLRTGKSVLASSLAVRRKNGGLGISSRAEERRRRHLTRREEDGKDAMCVPDARRMAKTQCAAPTYGESGKGGGIVEGTGGGGARGWRR